MLVAHPSCRWPGQCAPHCLRCQPATSSFMRACAEAGPQPSRAGRRPAEAGNNKSELQNTGPRESLRASLAEERDPHVAAADDALLVEVDAGWPAELVLHAHLAAERRIAPFFSSLPSTVAEQPSGPPTGASRVIGRDAFTDSDRRLSSGTVATGLMGVSGPPRSRAWQQVGAASRQQASRRHQARRHLHTFLSQVRAS